MPLPPPPGTPRGSSSICEPRDHCPIFTYPKCFFPVAWNKQCKQFIVLKLQLVRTSGSTDQHTYLAFMANSSHRIVARPSPTTAQLLMKCDDGHHTKLKPACLLVPFAKGSAHAGVSVPCHAADAARAPNLFGAHLQSVDQGMTSVHSTALQPQAQSLSCTRESFNGATDGVEQMSG